MEGYGLVAVVPILTVLLSLSSLNDLQFFLCVFYTLFQSARGLNIIGKCTSRHLFPYGEFRHTI